MKIKYNIDYKYPDSLEHKVAVIYMDKEFYGNLYFKWTPRDSPIYKHPLFYKKVDFNNCLFKRYVNFDTCIFRSKYILRNSTMNYPFTLTYCTFDSLAMLRKLNIDTSSFLQHNIYYDTVYFDSCEIIQPLELSYTKSLKYFIFSNNLIKSSVHMKYSYLAKSNLQMNTYNGFVDFSNTVFNDTANFFQSKFNGQVNFYDCVFDKYVDFRYSSFNGIVHFNNSVLPDTLDLRYLENISKAIDLTSCKLNSSNTRCLIALYGSDISKIRINLQLFKLWFPDSKDSYDKESSVYEQLLQEFKNEGLLSDYQELYGEYSHFKATHKTGFLSFLANIGDFLANIWSDYGFDPERIFSYTIILILFYTFIASSRLYELLTTVYIMNFIYESIRIKNLSYLKRWGYSFIYVSVIFFGLKIKIEDLKPMNKWTFFILWVYVSGLICVLFIARVIIK